MIKVLILNDVLTKGGKERRIVELLKYCKEYYHVNFEIIFMHDGIDFPEIYETNYPIHIIHWKNQSIRQSFRKINAITKAFQPDIIHSWASMTDIVAVVLKYLHKKKFVSSMIAEVLPFRSYNNKDYLRSKISFKVADIITSNTKAGILSYKAPLSKSICIYNGFNYERLNDLEDPLILKKEMGIENKVVIGMVAVFHPRKDYETVIISAKSLLKKYPEKFAFLLIGKGPDLDRMIQLAGDYAGKDIIFTGLINNVEKYINTFNLGILCTNISIHGEGISNSIMECMAMAKPVIATEGGGTREIVEQGKTGFLIPTNSPEALEDKIIYMMDYPEKAKEMGECGKDKIKESFSIESMCSTFYNIYGNLVKAE